MYISKHYTDCFLNNTRKKLLFSYLWSLLSFTVSCSCPLYSASDASLFNPQRFSEHHRITALNTFNFAPPDRNHHTYFHKGHIDLRSSSSCPKASQICFKSRSPWFCIWLSDRNWQTKYPIDGLSSSDWS